MLRLLDLVALLSLSHLGAGAAVPSPIDLIERQTAGCSAYTIINTRGTTEPQAESSGFITMNKAIRAALPSGETYNTVYPADSSQTSQVGTEDIIAHITSVLSTDPDHCFVLEGYSQGAKSTVQAMPSLTGASFDAVKAVFLIGNPYHKAGLACNVDLEGGESTLNVDGKSLTADNAIPDSWVSKTLDVCNKVNPPFFALFSLALLRYHPRVMDDGLTSRAMEYAIQPMAKRRSPTNILLIREIPKCRTSVPISSSRP